MQAFFAIRFPALHLSSPWLPVAALFLLFALAVWISTPLLLLVLLMCFVSRPDVQTLPTRSDSCSAKGILTTVVDWVAGGQDKPEEVDIYLCRVAVHRDRVFLGVLGRWIEVPKTWWKLASDLFPMSSSSEENAADPTVATVAAEAAARRAKQRRDFSVAAQAYEKLDTSCQADLDTLEAGEGCGPRQQQRHAEESGRCWIAARQPERAIAPLRRALTCAVDLESRQSAAEALAEASVDLAISELSRVSASSCKAHDASQSTVALTDACRMLFTLAAAEPQRCAGAARSAAKATSCLAFELIDAEHFGEAASLVQSILETAAETADGGADLQENMWALELEDCFVFLFLASLHRDNGDVCAASMQAEAILRRLPLLVSTAGVALSLDVARAAQDGDIATLEDVCREFDARHGPLASWQLDALLRLKDRLASDDLT